MPKLVEIGPRELAEAIKENHLMVPGELAGSIVIGDDLDGVVFERPWIAQQLGGGKFGGHRFHPILTRTEFTRSSIQRLDHEPKDIPFKSVNERISHWDHSRRRAIPGAVDRISEEINAGYTEIGITGRRATRNWARMTEAGLKRDNVPLQEVLYALHGIAVILSKLSAIVHKEISVFRDDDIPTVEFLSRQLRSEGVLFQLIFYGSRPAPDWATERKNVLVTPIAEWRQALAVAR